MAVGVYFKYEREASGIYTYAKNLLNSLSRNLNKRMIPITVQEQTSEVKKTILTGLSYCFRKDFLTSHYNYPYFAEVNSFFIL